MIGMYGEAWGQLLSSLYGCCQVTEVKLSRVRSNSGFVPDTISESLSDFLLKSQTPFEALWSLCSIDLRVIALHASFVNLRMPQNVSLVQLISEPMRVNVFPL